MTGPPVVTLEEAGPEREAFLTNLGQLYLYDVSDVGEWPVHDDGTFGAGALFRGCWSDPARHPFLIRADGEVAGFAIVDRGSRITDDPNVWDMGEFFVLRRWRRAGVGTQAVAELLARFPGTWEVRPFPGSARASAFWQTVCRHCARDGEVTSQSLTREDGRPAVVLRFATTADPT